MNTAHWLFLLIILLLVFGLFGLLLKGAKVKNPWLVVAGLFVTGIVVSFF